MKEGSIWPIDGTLTVTIILGQKGPGSNGNEQVLHSSRAPELELHCWVQFCVFTLDTNVIV